MKQQLLRYDKYSYFSTIKSQYRSAVRPYIEKLKKNKFHTCNGKIFFCEATGVQANSSECKVDHVVPFESVVRLFLEQQGLLDVGLEDTCLQPNKKTSIPQTIRVQRFKLKAKWIHFHNNFKVNNISNLRVVLSEFNLRMHCK